MLPRAQSPAAEDDTIEVALPEGLLWRLPALRRLGMPAPGWAPQLARATQVRGTFRVLHFQGFALSRPLHDICA